MATTNSGDPNPSPAPGKSDPNIVEFIYSFDRSLLPGGTSAASQGKPKAASNAIQRLHDGNRKYAGFIAQCKGSAAPVPVPPVELTPKEIGYIPNGSQFPPQLPFAAVLGCVDARAPVEVLFSQGFDSLYVMRVAGNSMGPDCVGSLHYAIHSFAALKPHPTPPAEKLAAPSAAPTEKPLRLVVVLGHSDCGAVTAAVKTLLGEAGYKLDDDASEFLTDDTVRGLLGRINVPAVRLAMQALPEDSFESCANSRELWLKSLIELSIYLNAAWHAHDAKAIVSQYGIEDDKKVDVRYGVFSPRDFFVRSVEGFRFDGSGEELLPPQTPGEALAEPPNSLSDLYKLAQRLATELKAQKPCDTKKFGLEKYFGLR